MDKLEHDIKDAFTKQDDHAKLANKEGLWSRLDSEMRPKKGVAVFWRIAAIFLGFLLVTGAGAALRMQIMQKKKLKTLQFETEKLTATIDSLLLLPLNTEVKIVEKEKVVYRDRSVAQKNTNVEDQWEARYQSLVDSTELVLANAEQVYKQEISRLTTELDAVTQKLAGNEKNLEEPADNKDDAPFQLKSERIEVEVSKKPLVKDPELGVKIFQRNFIENKNNLNSTIFKQTP